MARRGKRRTTTTTRHGKAVSNSKRKTRGGHESDELVWTEEEYDPSRYAYLCAPNLCPKCQEPLFDGCDCVDVDLAADSERRRKEYEDGLRQRGDGEKQQEGEQQKEVNDGGMRQEKQQQPSTRRQENVTQRWQGQKGKDTLIKTIELRMKQEETQERVSGEKEAR